MITQHLSKVLASILNPSIRMDNQSGARTTIPNAATKGRKYHFGTQRTTQRPTDYHAGKQIDKDGKIQPATRCGDVRYVRHPRLVRPTRGKIALQQVVRNRMGMFRIGGRPVFAPIDRTQTDCFHPAGNAILADWETHVVEFVRCLRATTTSFMFLENSPDMNIQAPVLYRPLAFRTITPAVIPTTRHRKGSAHLLDTPESAVLIYESEYLFGSLEKMATAS